MSTVIRYIGHPDGYLDFYMGEELILAQNSVDLITAQQLWDGILDVEDEQLASAFLGIASAEGKTQSISSPLTVTLFRNWRLDKEGAGNLSVTGGNVVSETFGVSIFEPNVNISVSNFLSTAEKVELSEAQLEAFASKFAEQIICN